METHRHNILKKLDMPNSAQLRRINYPYSIFRYVICASLICALSLSYSDQNIENGQTSKIKYSFFVAGHTYGKPGADHIGLHPPFVNNFDLIRENENIELGVLTGDIAASGSEKNWNEVDKELKQLDIPVYFAVGKHDMIDRELYENRYGKTFFSFKHRSDLYIVLDPNLDSWNISGDQLEFLKRILVEQASSVDHIFVFFHQVLWWSQDNDYRHIVVNSTQGRGTNINFWSEVAPLFLNMEIPVAMFAGDVGAFRTGSEYIKDRFKNITLIASGMGSGVNDNFVQVNIHEDKSVSFQRIHLD